jgi:hypothetical protein
MYSVFLQHFLFWRRKFLMEMVLAQFGTLHALSAHDEAVVHEIFRHLSKLHVSKKFEVL